jgi:GNAT superfamily N-acetyltransferase
MIFITKKLKQLSKKTKSLLKTNLTLITEGGTGSLMSDRLRDTSYYDTYSDVVILIKHYDQYIGWSMISFLTEHSSVPRIMVYIHPKYRRMGLGALLVKKSEGYVKKHNKKYIKVIPWDGRSSTFFSKLGYDVSYHFCDALKDVSKC